MLKFLLKRPIAVVMVFLGLLIIGIVTFTTLPVSLLPDIPIPEITVQITNKNTSARELENTVVTPVRHRLLQVGNLRNINSETRDGSSIIRLKFNYGTDIDLAFIEVNEKIDGSMNSLPREVSRPRVIKASATDIPVFYVNLSLKETLPYGHTDEYSFLNLSGFANNIVKRRIEQLPEVAMADITGYMEEHISIVPNMSYIETLGIRLSDIESVLRNNNVEPGSMVIRDGYYEYNIKFSSVLRTLNDIENIYIRKGERIFQLKDLAKVQLAKKPEIGMSMVNGKRAITLAIIKQSDETMHNLKESLNNALNSLKNLYPEIEFTINRNQTKLLDYTIGNLKQNLFIGFLLVFIVAILFLGDAKSPIIIGISMLSSLIISFVFFYLFNQSLNIISLSGMILAIGMMIDSAIIVTDIITQYREKDYSVFDSCVKGTNEVITPILSSTFTTISVFIPLVFLSGIAGAIFFDQAFAISVGLLVSYFTGIILLPVLYYIIYSSSWLPKFTMLNKAQKNIDKYIFAWYEKAYLLVFKRQGLFLILALLTIPLCVLLFNFIPKSSMPKLNHTETIAGIKWNENIHIDENKKRINELLKSIQKQTLENAVYVGNRQFLLDKENNLSVSEAEVYIKSRSPKDIESIKDTIRNRLKKKYPKTVIRFMPPQNVFEKIFDTKNPDVIAELYTNNRSQKPTTGDIERIQNNINNATEVSSTKVAFDEQIVVSVNKENLLRYKVSYGELHRTLKTAFKNNEIAVLRSYQQYLPIVLSEKNKTIDQILQTTMVRTDMKDNNKENIKIPLQSMVSYFKNKDLKTIISGKNGEYIPIVFQKVENPEQLTNKIKNTVKKDKQWEVQFSGNFLSTEKTLKELIVVLLISVLLMYFILAAQFESFVQPLVVLIELPIDIAAALILLWISGNTLNLMSAIGIVVTCGIIINDSILKIDMINELRKKGISLNEAIHTAGVKRLRAIIMTSLTTILAMTPILFSFDMGSELQKPFAIAIIGTMIVGTLVSIFIIPLVYKLIYRKTTADKRQTMVNN